MALRSSHFPCFSRRRFARFHRLPKEWADVMSRKKWATISEEALHQGVAAWNWLRFYVENDLANIGYRPTHGRMSKFFVERCVMTKMLDDEPGVEYAGLCLGCAERGALLWPLATHQISERTMLYYLDPNSEAHFVHMLNPTSWDVLEHTQRVNRSFCKQLHRPH